MYFDGRATQNRPANVPTIAQVQDGEGRMVASVWLLPTDPMIPYEARSRERHTARRVAGALAAAAGAGLGVWGASALLSAQDQGAGVSALDVGLVAGGGVGLGAGGALLLLDTAGAAVSFRW